MQIRDLLAGGPVPGVTEIRVDACLLDAAERLQVAGASALIVTGPAGVLGILSDRDLVRALAERGATIALLTVADVMDTCVVTCSMDDDVTDTLDRMSEAGVHHVPVVEDGRPVTILSMREFETACRYLKAQADTDDLTGLTNRRAFLRAMDAELNRYRRHRTPFAVAMLDVDRLKVINDRLGHAEGDRVLQEVARVLASELRSFDCIARIGGDEFAVLFPQTRLSEAVRACQRLVGACARVPLPRIDGVFRVGLSGGVTVAAAVDETPQTLLKRADESLYRAKSVGGARIVAARMAVPDHLSVA